LYISSPFNRFYHKCILTDLFNKCGHIRFNEYLDTSTNEILTLFKGEDYQDMNEMKQLLKLMNIDYKVNEKGDNKVSTRDIDNKTLCDHIEFCMKLAGENGICLDIVQDEWNRLIEQNR